MTYMKILLLLILFFPTLLSAGIEKLDSEIDRISTLSNKKQVHKALIEFKKKNTRLIEELRQSSSYEPDYYWYMLTLQGVLSHVTVKLADMPSCNSLKNRIKHS